MEEATFQNTYSHRISWESLINTNISCPNFFHTVARKSPEPFVLSLVFLSWAPAGASLCGQVLADPHPPATVHASPQ